MNVFGISIRTLHCQSSIQDRIRATRLLRESLAPKSVADSQGAKNQESRGSLASSLCRYTEQRSEHRKHESESDVHASDDADKNEAQAGRQVVSPASGG